MRQRKYEVEQNKFDTNEKKRHDKTEWILIKSPKNGLQTLAAWARSHIWSVHNFKCVHIFKFKSHPSGAWHLGHDAVIAFGTQSHAVLSNFSHRRYHSLPTTTKTRIKTITIHLQRCAHGCVWVWSVGFFSLSRSFYFCVKRHSQRCRCHSYHFVMRHIQNYSKTVQIHHGVQWAFGTHSLPLSSALVSVRLVSIDGEKKRKKNTEQHSLLNSSENCIEFHLWFNKRATAT